MPDKQPYKIKLPNPFQTGGLPLAEAISQRRSVRHFSPSPLALFQISQLLWAAQGITSPSGRQRAIPSAGGTYPLQIFVVIGESGVEKLESGAFHYEITDHSLQLLFSGDIRAELAAAALSQDAIAVAPVSLIIAAISENTLVRYNVRGERYVFMEVGHAGQNIYLQATAIGLGTCAIGAFRDEEVRRILQLDTGVRPLYIMPVGKPA